MKRVLIVGGCGFIGSAIRDVLVDKGYRFGIYDMSADTASIPQNIPYYQGDILKDDNLVEIFSKYDVLIYLLSSIMPQQSMDNPEEIYTKDIPMLLRVLEICNKAGIKRVIYSSSGGAVYGEHNLPNSEDMTITNPQNHYAICKLTCEKILLLYNRLYEMDNIVLRVANPYGINQRIESGVGAISAFIKKIMNDEPVIVYGDGEVVRDYIPVENVAKAFMMAIEWNQDASIIPVFNVGSGEGLSLNRIIEIISESLEKNPSVEYIEPREFDVRSSVLNMSKTEKYIGIINRIGAEDAIREYCNKTKSIS